MLLKDRKFVQSTIKNIFSIVIEVNVSLSRTDIFISRQYFIYFLISSIRVSLDKKIVCTNPKNPCIFNINLI